MVVMAVSVMTSGFGGGGRDRGGKVKNKSMMSSKGRLNMGRYIKVLVNVEVVRKENGHARERWCAGIPNSLQ